MADPFDEFEFKPLTEGLGFHKKNKKDASAPITTGPIGYQKSISASMALLDNPMDFDSPMQPPLPRSNNHPLNKTQFKTPEVDDSSAAVEEILQTLRSKKAEVTKSNITPKTATPVRYKASLQNISVFILDAMLVLAATLLCMIVVLSVTKVDISAAFLTSESSAMIYLATFALFALVSFVYLAGHRVFMGATPGEWAYDQRIGRPEQMGTASYALSVIARSAVVVITGIILLPLISIIARRDFVGALSNTQILERT